MAARRQAENSMLGGRRRDGRPLWGQLERSTPPGRGLRAPPAPGGSPTPSAPSQLCACGWEGCPRPCACSVGMGQLQYFLPFRESFLKVYICLPTLLTQVVNKMLPTYPSHSSSPQSSLLFLALLFFFFKLLNL